MHFIMNKPGVDNFRRKFTKNEKIKQWGTFYL